MTKILVIEDESILCDEIVEWLTLEDYEAIGAVDGVDGVNQALQHQPDLVICDITMPRLDGYGVLLELRANPATTDVPFIFVTARAAHDDIRTGMDLGADDYITKPFTRLELLHAVETRLAKKILQEQKYQQSVSQWQDAFEKEREQRLLKAKLVAMFSHDFRNPLASIMSANTLLRDYGDKMDASRQQMYFNRIDASIRQLMQMLDDMLFVAQVETGNFDFKPEPLHLTEFVKNIVNEFQSIYGKSHPLTYESDFTDVIRADPRLMRQIAANLISNAIKYSPQFSEVQVSLVHQPPQVCLTVRDSGIGIPEADQQRLFNAFQRASNVGDIRGTGLGLAIVKQAVDLHAGSIHLQSTVGVGTTVQVVIPMTH